MNEAVRGRRRLLVDKILHVLRKATADTRLICADADVAAKVALMHVGTSIVEILPAYMPYRRLRTCTARASCTKISDSPFDT